MNPFNRHARLRENLSAYVDGELAAGETRDVEKHLETCEACRAELEGLRLASAALGDMPAVDAQRSFALTPDMVAAPRPPVSAAPSPALNAGLRLAAAGLAVALAAVMIVDNADFGGDGDTAQDSGSSAVEERDFATSGAAESLKDAAADESGEADTAAPMEPAATSAPGTATAGGATSGDTGVGGANVSGSTPAPADAEATRASTGAEPTSDASVAQAAPGDEEDAGEGAVAESLTSADGTDGGASALELIEALLAALLGAAIGGLIVLWIARRQTPV